MSSVDFYFNIIEEGNQSINNNNNTPNEKLNKQQILYVLNKKTNQRKLNYVRGIQNRDQNLKREKGSVY